MTTLFTDPPPEDPPASSRIWNGQAIPFELRNEAP